jgi:hypothetical protein
VNGRTGGDATASSAATDQRSLPRTLVSLVTDPEGTFRDITREPAIGWAVAIVVVVSLVHGLHAGLAWGAGEQWLAIFPAEPPPGRFAPGGLVVPIVAVVVHPLIAGLLHLLARLFEGSGALRGMFAGYAFALAPSALTILGLLPTPLGWLGPLAGFWSLALVIYAVRANERLSLPAAVAVIVLPLLVPAVIATGVLVFA